MTVPVPQPILVVQGNHVSTKAIFLFTDKTLVCKVEAKIPLVLLGAFYVFNVEYTTGCVNTFQFLEAYFLGNTALTKKNSIGNFLSQLENMSQL